MTYEEQPLRSLCMPHADYSGQLPPNTVPTQLTRNTFNEFSYSGRDSLIEFYTDWCGACRRFQPKFEMLAAGLQQYGVQCGQVNIDRERDLARLYGINK